MEPALRPWDNRHEIALPSGRLLTIHEGENALMLTSWAAKDEEGSRCGYTLQRGDDVRDVLADEVWRLRDAADEAVATERARIRREFLEEFGEPGAIEWRDLIKVLNRVCPEEG